jgi:hypothetical protein
VWPDALVGIEKHYAEKSTAGQKIIQEALDCEGEVEELTATGKVDLLRPNCVKQQRIAIHNKLFCLALSCRTIGKSEARGGHDTNGKLTQCKALIWYRFPFFAKHSNDKQKEFRMEKNAETKIFFS